MNQDLGKIREFFRGEFAAHGESAEGVGWNSTFAQEVRFAQLMKVVEPGESWTLLEFGCGYGHLVDYLDANSFRPERYIGVDIVHESLDAAKKRFAGRENLDWRLDANDAPRTDYLVASGVFNIKLDESYEDWTGYVLENLNNFYKWTKKGFAVNFLTKYSDEDRMAARPDLYYADPCFLFDYCKRRLSRNVALLHDYEIYDFTLIVRK